MAQVVEHLLYKWEALHSNPKTTKKEKTLGVHLTMYKDLKTMYIFKKIP
jgi:hypothetical protein